MNYFHKIIFLGIVFSVSSCKVKQQSETAEVTVEVINEENP